MRKDDKMSSRKRSSFGEWIGIFGSAVAAASAVNAGHQPKARDLRVLGIDPEKFRQIKHF
jgi:hypothetical protein